MTIDILPLGFLQTNCYIVSEGGKCIAIDPGDDPEQVLSLLRKKNLDLEAIVLTHGHFDHVGGVEALVKETGCALWIHELDYSYGPKYPQMFPLSDCKIPVHFLADGQKLHMAGMQFSVLETPGHTWGSVCICAEDAMFSGDTLFAGSIGRTDLAGGDIRIMQKSLGKLKALDINYTVYPGHGPKTTLDREKRVNPYMR